VKVRTGKGRTAFFSQTLTHRRHLLGKLNKLKKEISKFFMFYNFVGDKNPTDMVEM
jgi:hypothetical protein